MTERRLGHLGNAGRELPARRLAHARRIGTGETDGKATTRHGLGIDPSAPVGFAGPDLGVPLDPLACHVLAVSFAVDRSPRQPRPGLPHAGSSR